MQLRRRADVGVEILPTPVVLVVPLSRAASRARAAAKMLVLAVLVARAT